MLICLTQIWTVLHFLEYYETVTIGFRIFTENKDRFCIYHSTDFGHGILFESNRERYEEISSGVITEIRQGDDVQFSNINICCKALKELFVTLLDFNNNAHVVYSYNLDPENSAQQQEV